MRKTLRQALSLLATYWSAIDVVLHVVDTAVIAATIDETTQQTVVDKPIKTTNHWFKQQLLDEKAALDRKIENTYYLINHNTVFLRLNAHEQELTIVQHEVMEKYSKILQERIDAFDTTNHRN